MSDPLPGPEGNRGATPTWDPSFSYRRLLTLNERLKKPVGKASCTSTGQSGEFYVLSGKVSTKLLGKRPITAGNSVTCQQVSPFGDSPAAGVALLSVTSPAFCR